MARKRDLHTAPASSLRSSNNSISRKGNSKAPLATAGLFVLEIANLKGLA